MSQYKCPEPIWNVIKARLNELMEEYALACVKADEDTTLAKGRTEFLERYVEHHGGKVTWPRKKESA